MADSALIDTLQACADDPMWDAHAEVPKSLLHKAIKELRACAQEPLNPALDQFKQMSRKAMVNLKGMGGRSDDYLQGFEDGVRAHVDAVSALDTLPIITKEQGLAMRTGRPTPNDSALNTTKGKR